ncbi:MAG: class I SAM-dependent methyltransferase [bacterium]
MTHPNSELAASYDRVAERYAKEYFAELDRKPRDRELLDEFVQSLSSGGPVCEIGCGPGQIARYLKDRGLEMRGVDLSEEMVKWATRLNPDISFAQGEMLALDIPDGSLAGIVSFYAIIHLQREDMTRALREMCRVLKPGGRLLVSFHGGEGELHRDEWYGEPVSIDVTLMTDEEVRGYLETAGLEVEKIVERNPYEFEYPTQRLYAFSTKRMKGKG